MLFIPGEFQLHSGQISNFKIECDSLNGTELELFAKLIAEKVKFKKVVGVPTGGDRLEAFLSDHITDDDTLPILIVDDVLTTGNSIKEIRKTINDKNVVGVVLFARGKCPKWVTPIFTMWK